ncbi:MAG: hypothetical protein A2583_06395 [Bdellovibrionales bacterium RIFOXYD1_FULL_53_11]|nr:MAG: hypothetical protein A2583_06395 [Bdellovibrionales bacterium RIFOXYD1_FULL_53_11]
MYPQHPRPSRVKSAGAHQQGYFAEDTIAAISSGTAGAITVVRISGPAAHAAVEALADSGSMNRNPPRKIFNTNLYARGGQKLDQAMAVYFRGPRSFTGEDMAELYLHGGAVVASGVMAALEVAGIRRALPGEFSFRAVKNGKFDLIRAQASADLIAATSDAAARLALEKMEQGQGKVISGIVKILMDVAVRVEAGLDFSDQEHCGEEAENERARTVVELKKAEAGLLSLKNGYERGRRIQHGIKTALIGLPNAGKSSLFNALVGEDCSIVSDLPGTTRDVLRERITLRGAGQDVALIVEDTAGLHDPSGKVETEGVLRARRAAMAAELLIFVVDPRTTPELAEKIRDEWQSMGAPAHKTIGVVSKCDLVRTAGRRRAKEALLFLDISIWFETAAMTGEGIDRLKAGIADYCGKWVSRDDGEILLTDSAQYDAVSEALEHVGRAVCTKEGELVAADTRRALHALRALAGGDAAGLSEEVLGGIFSRFCIGK